MLKKKIATTVTAVTRLCSCGKTVTIAATDSQTVCECGKVVYSAKNDENNNNNINGESTHAEAKFEAKNNSAESSDSK
ncbi:MAG: hypothetical protein U9R15_10570 [Chloroflexota bacterium]|nr:hypothetical protein [Chloroflexota bacterium]